MAKRGSPILGVFHLLWALHIVKHEAKKHQEPNIHGSRDIGAGKDITTSPSKQEGS
jgi:hypothetical protein